MIFLVSLMDKERGDVSCLVVHKLMDGSNIFQFIELVGEPFKENNRTKHLCRIGAATTNEQFRAWAMDAFHRDPKSAWTVPWNVVMVESTYGGTNAMLCHVALDYNNQTISDLVTEIEFVNPKGQLQTVGYKITDSDEKQTQGREWIKSAGGAFGILGVVTSLTIKLDAMTYARMKPTKPRLALTVPSA